MKMPFSASMVTDAVNDWAARLREQADIPVLLRWQGQEPGYRLGHFDQPRVIMDMRDAAGAAAMLSPALDALGEAYVEGHLDVHGTVHDIIDVAHRLSEFSAQAEDGSVMGGLTGRVARLVSQAVSHTRDQDRKAIQYHYDLSNAFYAQWLDPAMVYSCAYFESGDETLEVAQQKKIDHILRKLRLQPQHTLLDIGCGWGALVIRAAQQYGVRCVGITLSQNQHELARERVKERGLAHLIDIRLEDYRDVQGPFDRISSVGMFEHVGLKNLEMYFRRVHDLLAPDGWALNHGITSSDPDSAGVASGGSRFIDKYVFPDGEVPHVSLALSAMQRAGLECIDAENLRRHYVLTLRHWSDASEAQADTLRQMVDERYWRIWRMYLVGSQWAFEHDENALFQLLCHRAGQPAEALPWSRRWMYP